VKDTVARARNALLRRCCARDEEHDGNGGAARRGAARRGAVREGLIARPRSGTVG